MKRRSGVPTRSEVSETVRKHESDMEEKAGELNVLASDTETVRDTLDSLDFGGTAEGTDTVQSTIEQAEDVTVEIFEREDGHLEQIQSDAQDHQGELHERTDSTEMDLGKISDASGHIETQETTGKLSDAKNAVLEDKNFLTREIEQAEEAGNENERRQEELRNRVLNKRR